MIKYLSLIYIIVVHLVRDSACQCGTCMSAAAAACLSETQFQLCFNGEPSGELLSCPANHVCTADPALCLPASSAAVPICVSQCGVCGTAASHACLSQTHFALCYSHSIPSSTITSCPANLVCSNSAPNYCVKRSQAAPDCSNLPSTGFPDQCPGRFPLPIGTDCKQYIYCFYRDGVVRGQIYTCQGTTIFNPTMQQCVVPSAAFDCNSN